MRLHTGWNSRLAALALLAFGSLPLDLATAQEPPKQELPKYEVTGFREARFGMTEAEVRAAVSKAFALKPADLATSTNPIEGTAVLSVRLASLDPAPGPAQVSYIFGYGSKKLIQVNVIWGSDSPNPSTDSNAMIAAGSRLERYFAGFAWRKDAARSGIPVGDNTVALFASEDEKKGAVRLIVDGVKYQMQREGKETASPDPKGPAKLIINYIADRDNPDVARIEKGKF
jgi:hypothetical protein